MRKAFTLAAILLPCALFAQTPLPRLLQPQTVSNPSQANTYVYAAASLPLPDNYQVALTSTDKDGELPEISVVVASTHFNVTLQEPQRTLDGRVKIEDSGEITLEYTLGWETRAPIPTNPGGFKIIPSSIKSSVRLKLGQEVQIFCEGAHMMRLSIKKLSA